MTDSQGDKGRLLLASGRTNTVGSEEAAEDEMRIRDSEECRDRRSQSPTSRSADPQKEDRMESFVLSETLKVALINHRQETN